MIDSIRIQPYGALLYFTSSIDEFTKQYINISGNTNFSVPVNAAGMSSDFENGMIHIVGVFDSDICTIVHELSHVCIKILCTVGIPINKETSEAFTYLLSYLISVCVKTNGDIK